jgi:membrane-associated protease RseP (regulator of RpoE activity)
MKIRLTPAWREYGLPILLFLASVVTTAAIGARFMQNFLDGRPMLGSDADLWPWSWLFNEPSRILLGIPFSFTLLGILLTHEFGHYFACRYHRIRCTLPWVLPAPTLSGTAGAVIQIRGAIPGRQALMDVGVYGPIAGYIASLIAVVTGFLLSRPMPSGSEPQLVMLGQPLTFTILHWLVAQMHAGTPTFALSLRHPVLIAGWIGLFVTSLNLIPGGQLDGGHILYAISPRIHKISSRVLPVVLLLFGLFLWLGWILWGSVLLLSAMRHPRVPVGTPLSGRSKFLAWTALAILVLTFSAEPFAGTSLLHYFFPHRWH